MDFEDDTQCVRNDGGWTERYEAIQFAGHLPVVRCDSKSLGKSLSALSIGGPGIEMRLQNPLPWLNAITFPNCSRIRFPPCPCWTFFSNDVRVLVSMRQAGH